MINHNIDVTPIWDIRNRPCSDLDDESVRLARMVQESRRRADWEAKTAQARAEGWVPADQLLFADDEPDNRDLYSDLMGELPALRAESAAYKVKHPGRRRLP